MIVKGLDKLLSNIKAEVNGRAKDFSTKTFVGFSASYALHVEYNLEAHHNNGQALFFTDAIKQNDAKLRAMVLTNMKHGMPFKEASLLAGLYLQAQAQKLTPVKTGFLKNSAFTRQD